MTSIVQYSTTFPDGRVLAFIPTDPPTYKIDGKDVKKAEAEKAWNAQPDAWQRGRTLDQTINHWLGRR
jgi:hypothetical protein